MATLSSRKADHLELAIHGDVGFKSTTTLFDQVRLVHDALPELAVDDLDTTSKVLGKCLSAPILIAAMTGGTERAREINRELASVAEERGYAFGLGSQRAMHKDSRQQRSYQVRDVAPNVLLLGNVGVVQAREMSLDALEELVGSVDADALCVHLNPAMELVQSDGDRDFRCGVETLQRVEEGLSVPVVAKETGCGLSPKVGQRLRESGVRHVDVSGAGGTSWVAVETLRAEPAQRPIGEAFWDWGIPTAASVALMARHHFDTVFATGGLRSGVELAKAIALGASAGGIARHALQALDAGGRAGCVSFLSQVEAELRVAMLLTGSRRLRDLARAPRILGAPLREWLEIDLLPA